MTSGSRGSNSDPAQFLWVQQSASQGLLVAVHFSDISDAVAVQVLMVFKIAGCFVVRISGRMCMAVKYLCEFSAVVRCSSSQGSL